MKSSVNVTVVTQRASVGGNDAKSNDKTLPSNGFSTKLVSASAPPPCNTADGSGGAPTPAVVENLKFLGGLALLLVFAPYVIVQVACCTLWEFVDKKTVNMIGLCGWLEQKLASTTKRFVRNETDGFIFLEFLWLGIALPAWFFYELHYAYNYGVDYKRIFAYNLFRIGPMYMNFMYVYTLSHKEAHSFSNLFVKPLNTPLKYVFNHWCGMFHGVLPGTFTYSHVYNHHRYDNGELDTITTAYRPRDEIKEWVRYSFDFITQYAANLGTIISFIQEGRYAFALGTALSTLWYVAFVSVCYYIQPWFTTLTLIYAFFEGNILLSVVNFVWHAFIDEDDPTNDYVNSMTIVDGLNFTLKEEYHVVHHQYAGAHWTKHEALYEKHASEYKNCLPTAFTKVNIFEVFGFIVAKDYDKLAEVYYEPLNSQKLSKKEIAAIMKRRLQSHGPLLANRVGRTHK